MRRSKILVTIGIVLVAIAAGVRFIAAPAFIRFPLGIDRHYTYTGTVVSHVNPVTLAPLAVSRPVPLTVNREIKVVSGSFSTAVVQETISMHFAGRTTNETYRYSLDRRSMQLTNGADTYALNNPANLMNPASSYRINLPLGASSSTAYKGFVPQSDSVVTMQPQGPAHHSSLSNSSVVTHTFSADHPVAGYYRAQLAAQGFPMSISGATFEAQLRAKGINLGAVTNTLRSALSPSQFAALSAVLAKPVPLTYSYFEQGSIGVDQPTGAVVTASSAREGIAVAPDLSGFSTLSSLLSRLAAVPAIKSVEGALAKAAPTPVITFSYTETPASAQSAASEASSQATMIDVLELWLPIGLAALGVILALVGLLTWRRRPPLEAVPPPSPAPQPEEPKLPV